MWPEARSYCQSKRQQSPTAATSSSVVTRDRGDAANRRSQATSAVTSAIGSPAWSSSRGCRTRGGVCLQAGVGQRGDRFGGAHGVDELALGIGPSTEASVQLAEEGAEELEIISGRLSEQLPGGHLGYPVLRLGSHQTLNCHGPLTK